MKFLVFARWSQIDHHFEMDGIYDTEEEAAEECARQLERGAIATRIEQREMPAVKGNNHVDKDA